MSESENMEPSTGTGSQKDDTEDEDVSNEKLSIQQILEGMTNEFNKTGTKKAGDSGKRVNRTEVVTCKEKEKPQVKVTEENVRATRAHKCISAHDEEMRIKMIKENLLEKKADKSKKDDDTIGKQDNVNKKDGNIPRIVLTFRTIDENTDHGKKTKISSCASNLSLVPDELVNCDQIGGVSVKIENFDEVCESVHKSDTTSNKTNTNVKNNKSPNASNENKKINENEKIENTNLQKDNQPQDSPQLNPKLNLNAQNTCYTSSEVKNSEESESAQTITRKSRQKRSREPSFSEELGLKRSARRLSKELGRGTVLESAMARKEKFNYTEESTKRRYSRPGRPRKFEKREVYEYIPEKKEISKLSEKKETSKNINKKKETSKPNPEKKEIPKLILQEEEISILQKKEIPKSMSEEKDILKLIPEKKEMPKLISRRKDIVSKLSEYPYKPQEVSKLPTSQKKEIPNLVPEEKEVSNLIPRKEKIKPVPEIKEIPQLIPGKKEMQKLIPDRKEIEKSPLERKEVVKSNIERKEMPKAASERKELPKLNPLDPKKSNTEKKALPKLCPLTPPKNMSPVKNDVINKNLNNSPKSNKYEGMPKLTPIVKSCEIIQPGYNDSVNSNGPLNTADKPFLKPISSLKLKRDRNKSRITGNARKIAKGGIYRESLPVATESENSMEEIVIEENLTPIKRTRRNTVPSPSTAEGMASKPESTAILKNIHSDKSINKKLELQCLCEVRSQLFVTITSADAPLYCTALDSIDNRIVGCSNEVDHDDVAMRRPSSRIPFIILCRVHKERLIRHNCCPTCGFFCSQGKFVHCSNGHQYHRDCEMYYDKKPLCPHCGSYGISFDVIITMTGKRKPTSAPVRKQSKGPSAKITLPGSGDNTKLAEQQPILQKSTEPLISPDVVKIPEPTPNTTTNGEKPERYTLTSLYNAVKNGELQKLVNVLACGFNANHSFRDQGQRTCLHIAADKGLLACVHVLVQAGAQLDVLDRNQLSPLMLAATNGKADVVRYLMRCGTDVTLKGEDGMTALHMAAKSGHLEVCRIILSECKVPRTLVDSVDDGGWTSLIWACEFRHAEVARFLLENKCDPLIRDAEQNIALHWSAFSGSSEITELLLNLGCDVNAVNVHGDTPLHIASRQDQYAVSVLLLSRGAKIGEVNAIGETAIDCCGGTGDTMNALQLNFKVNQQADNLLERTVRILTNDISRGKESNPVQCVNGLDSEDKPTDFVYVTENCFTSNVNVDRTISSLQSCRCEDTCSSDKCLCGNISLRCWYDEEGKLVPEFNYADPPMLFECNPACDCNKITCNNRVVQHGLTQRFQLFRTEGKGWGLRTLRHIPKGTYVCEYVGEIISDCEADQREDDSYLFDLDNRDGETYCIDARRYGNLARFINHSCAPNLLPVRVFVEHQDLHFPRIAFFANRDIEVEEELGFDYGEKFWIIKCKSFTCTCGAENCRYSEKTIQITLDTYRKKVQQEEMLSAQSSTTQTT